MNFRFFLKMPWLMIMTKCMNSSQKRRKSLQMKSQISVHQQSLG